jgi:SAM-dependent methyltransferase
MQGFESVNKVLAMLRAPANSVAFALRRQLRWRRGQPVLASEDKRDLFSYLDDESAQLRCERRQAELLARYDLADLRACSCRADYRDNLYVLDAMEMLFESEPDLPQTSLRAIDVGSKNWNYVFALERFWRHWRSAEGRAVQLIGIEIDGYGIYRDLHSRCDHAQAYARQTGNPAVDYRVEDFMDFEVGAVDVLTIFYPFLTRYALLQWGLPPSLFQPGPMVEKALRVVRPGGHLVIFNQTREEREILASLLDTTRARVLACVRVASPLVEYHERTSDRWATLVRVAGAAPG